MADSPFQGFQTEEFTVHKIVEYMNDKLGFELIEKSTDVPNSYSFSSPCIFKKDGWRQSSAECFIYK